MEFLTTLVGGSALGIAGILASITCVIVQVAKNLLPKNVPTKLVTIITAFFVMFAYLFMTGAFVSGAIASTIILGIFGGFIVAFIAMFGFDSFKDIMGRFGGGENGGDK